MVVTRSPTCTVFPLQDTMRAHYVFSQSNMEVKDSPVTTNVISIVPGLFDPQDIFIEALLCKRCIRRVPFTQPELEVSEHIALHLYRDVDVTALSVSLHDDVAVVHAVLVVVLGAVRGVATDTTRSIVLLPLSLQKCKELPSFHRNYLIICLGTGWPNKKMWCDACLSNQMRDSI